MKRLVLFTIIILTVVIGALALWLMHEAVQLMLLAITLAAGLAPDVRTLTARGISRSRAVTMVFSAMLVIVLGVTLLVSTLAYSEVVQAIADVPTWYDSTRNILLRAGGWREIIGAAMPTTAAIAATPAASGLGDLGNSLVNLTGSIIMITILVITVISLGFYWLQDEQRFERLWLSLLPIHARVRARAIGAAIYNELGIYIRGEASIVMLTIISLLSVYSIVGLPGATLLAIIGGLVQVVPLLGIPLALLPALLIALTGDVRVAGMTLVLALLVLGIIKFVIAPRLFQTGITINPVLVIILIMALAQIGLLFILLGPPLAAAIQTSIRVLIGEQTTLTSSVEGLHVLRKRLILIEAQLTLQQPHDPRLQDMLKRADRLLEEADQVLESPEFTANNHKNPLPS